MKTRNIQSKPIDEMADIDTGRYTQKVINITYDTPISGVEKQNYIHDVRNREKNMPSYQATTNVSNNKVYNKIEHTNNIQLQRNIPIYNIDMNNVFPPGKYNSTPHCLIRDDFSDWNKLRG
jgi:hypothetical protein